MTILCRIKRIA